MPDENGKPIWKSMTCWGAALLGVALAWMGYDSVPEGFIAEFTANVDRYILGAGTFLTGVGGRRAMGRITFPLPKV